LLFKFSFDGTVSSAENVCYMHCNFEKFNYYLKLTNLLLISTANY